MRRLFIWNKLKNTGFLIVLAAGNLSFSMVEASDFQYFGSKIDYWNESEETKKTETLQKKVESPSPLASETTNSEGSFSWPTYLDPKNKEFFKEGDYTPPAPFMELVRNPSDNNIKMWFAYLDKKNELTQRLQERMQEYLAKNSLSIESTGKETMKARLASLPVTAPDAKRFRFRMYFDSHCPHCKQMFGTLADLQAKGFYVEAKQVDSDPRGMEGVTIPSTRASLGELKEKDIKSVPVLLIGDLQKKEVYRLTGYQSTANVFAAIASNK